jgi:hypothetical protein
LDQYTKRKRFFSKVNINEFKQLLQETWENVFVSNDVNTSYNAFIGSFQYYFDRAFPLKSSVIRNNYKHKWITNGLIVSRRKMCFLNWLKRTIPLASEILNYIHNYQSVLRKIIKEAKKRENDKLVLHSKNKTETLWQCINKELETLGIINVI